MLSTPNRTPFFETLGTAIAWALETSILYEQQLYHPTVEAGPLASRDHTPPPHFTASCHLLR
jgi:hypothetical protein